MAEKGKRGFAGMDPEKQRQIASKGGKAAHQKGRAHEFTSEEARAAGRKARHGSRRTAALPAENPEAARTTTNGAPEQAPAPERSPEPPNTQGFPETNGAHAVPAPAHEAPAMSHPVGATQP
jgi:hypothetical protein